MWDRMTRLWITHKCGDDDGSTLVDCGSGVTLQFYEYSANVCRNQSQGAKNYMHRQRQLTDDLGQHNAKSLHLPGKNGCP